MLPQQFMAEAFRLNASRVRLFDQADWLGGLRQRRGFADPYMHLGACNSLCVEWLALARQNRHRAFFNHIDRDAGVDILQWLTIQQDNNADMILSYLKLMGLTQNGEKQYLCSGVWEIAADLSARARSFYLILVSPNRPVNPGGVRRSGHALAVETGVISRVFDPNFGVAEFRNVDDVGTFFAWLLVRQYRNFMAHTRLAGLCDILRFQ